MGQSVRKQKGDCTKSSLLTGVFAILLVTVIGVSAVVLYRYHDWKSSKILDAGETANVVIPYGTTWSSTAKILEAEGIIKHPLFFNWWAMGAGLTHRVRAGSYELTGPLTLEDLKKMLLKGGDSDDVRLTIPEGYSIYKIADKLKELGLTSRSAFLDAVRDKQLLDEFAIPGESMEGYLYPNTYRFKKGVTAEKIVRTLYQEWQKRWEQLLRENEEAYLELAKRYNFTIHHFITLASIVERESHVKEELPKIARVFYNRLDKGMKLQTDPTCVYGPTTYNHRPSPKTCRDPLNRYSTYVIKGLPPGPISNPGIRAIEAVLRPSDSPEAKHYLYFVARRDRRGHTFSSTYKEHRRAVKKLQRQSTPK